MTFDINSEELDIVLRSLYNSDSGFQAAEQNATRRRNETSAKYYREKQAMIKTITSKLIQQKQNCIAQAATN